jgi:hypothetical protein
MTLAGLFRQTHRRAGSNTTNRWSSRKFRAIRIPRSNCSELEAREGNWQFDADSRITVA